MQKKSYFKSWAVPILLIAPQLIITLVFFIWPAYQTLRESFIGEDPFGLHSHFVWFYNFISLFTSHDYLNSFVVTLVFSFSVAVAALIGGLFFATLANRAIKGAAVYKTLLIWPYAVAPAVAGILLRFIFDPATGVMTGWLAKLGYHWNYVIHPDQAMFLVIIAAVWQQTSYNFLFYLAGLQSIPKSLLEAAAIDGAGPFRRFRYIVFPLLSPITFFLMTINLIYAFFDTFGVIQVVTQGGPENATETLVYKVYQDGFMGLDFGSSAAQSVILMIIIVTLVFLQFRVFERKVHYHG